MKNTPDALLAAALALKPAEFSRLTFEPLTAKSACVAALARLAAVRAELKRHYPRFELAEFDTLVELCDRIAAQQRIVKMKAQSHRGQFAARAPAALGWRRSLLPMAVALSQTGSVPRAAVAGIKKGKGVAENVSDVIDLVDLLTPHRAKVEAMLGKNALSHAREAARHAIEATGASRRRSEVSREAAELRDRYAAVLVARHDRLRAALAAVVGYREAGAQVPPLGRSTG